MPQIPNLRLLFSNPNPSLLYSPLRFPPSLYLLLKPPNKTLQSLKPFSILASSFKKQRTHTKPLKPFRPFSPTGRKNSSLSEKIDKEGSVMEENDSFVYNRKRAAGRDKNDRPKSLQLKVRKLNPVNTICYVQVMCV